MTLKSQTLSGVKWTAVSTIIVTFVQLLQLSILARLLSPSDFGLMAIVMVVIGFSQAFLDMGISNAIIHKQTITKEQLSTLYWLNVLAGIVLFVIICMTAPVMAFFYKEPELTKLIILVGLTFLIQPFGQQFMVLWQKEMRFAVMSKIDVGSKFLSLVVSVGFAYAGYGVYALVYGTIAATVLQTILFVFIGLKEHRPQMVFRWGEINEFMSFGAYQMGERTINYFNSQLDVILIGKLLGTETLGIYNVAKQLIMRPAQIINPIITKVTFPAMAKVQNDTETLKRVYLKTIHYLSSINFLIYSMLVVFAPEIIFILFGYKWRAAVPIVQILSIYGVALSIGNPIGSLLLAKGRANLAFYWNLLLLFCLPAGIAIASHWGLLGVTWMRAAFSATLVIPGWYFLVRPLCGAKLGEYVVQIAMPLALSVVTGIVVYFISHLISGEVFRLILGVAFGILLYFGLSWQFNRCWVDAMRELLPRKFGT